MTSDIILMIPVLSKELTLIGHPSLPFKIVKPTKRKAGNGTIDEAPKITFDSKSMIVSLTSVCLDLVKQIKLFGENNDDALDKIRFENTKLEKQLKIFESDINKREKAFAAEKESNRQLQEQVLNLQKRIKDLEIHRKKMAQRNQTAEDLLKHSLKKQSSELIELHEILWKRLNIVNKNIFSANLTIMQSNQPDFSKLWSEVKYSDIKTRESVLKEAVIIFQKNNKILREDNVALKTFLMAFIQEVNEVQELMCQKMDLPKSVLFNYKIEDVCPDRESLNFSLCKNILSSHLNLLRSICLKFQESECIIADNVFVCWSDLICNLLDI